MKTKSFWILVSIAILCAGLIVMAFGISPAERSHLDYFDISTLRGLKAVRTRVMLAKDENEKFFGLDQHKLYQQVDNALRKAGIEILTSPENRDDARFVVLVQLAKAGIGIPFCALNVESGLYQTVQLTRDRRIRSHTKTWPSFAKSRFGIVPLSRVSLMIKETIASQLEEFTNDYLAANPRQDMLTGTVRYLEIEGGFYGIVADNGQHYDPVNLPKEYAKDGLRVRFIVKEKKEATSFHMWGKIVEIIEIERL